MKPWTPTGGWGYEHLIEEGDSDSDKQSKLDELANKWGVNRALEEKDMETYKLVFGTDGEASQLTLVERMG